MRIVHIVSSSGFYGKEQVILSLVRRQRQDPESLLVVMGDRALHERTESLGLRTVHLPGADGLLPIIHKESQAAEAQGSGLILHAHDYKSGILIAGASLVRRHHHPMVRTLHGFTSANKPWFSKLRMYEALDRLLLSTCDRVVGVSPDMGARGVANAVIVNGIEWPEVSRSRSRTRPDELVVACIARLSPEKNPENLIRAFAILNAKRQSDPDTDSVFPKLRLRLVGDGPLRDRARTILDELGLQDQVILEGYRTDATAIIASADLYIQPSFTEGMPISVLEALAVGTPTVVTRVGGMARLIEQGAATVCGTAPESIARGIQAALSDEQAGDRVAAGKRLIETDYAADVMAGRYRELYQDLLRDYRVVG